MDERDWVVIVTGASSGIGAATAKRLAAGGAKVVVNYHGNAEGAAATASVCDGEADGAAIVVQGDVASDGDCRRIAKAAVDKWGRIDGLVNNAGATRVVAHGDLDGLTAEDFDHSYRVNVLGAFQMTRACAPHLRHRGRGAVVNVSSIGGVDASGSSIAYCASKAALNNLTVALARVLAPEIRVNAVCPGFVETTFLRGMLGDQGHDALIAGYQRDAPLRRNGTPENMAETILFFLDKSPDITGQVMVSDGGMHLKGWTLS